MKKLATTLTLLLSSACVLADSAYPQNPVLRPLTLTDGTVQVSAGLAYGEEEQDKRWDGGISFGYGMTDNLTLGYGGMTYRFLARPENDMGLELTASFGVKGQYDSLIGGDTTGYGLDVRGKYVINEDLAMTFGLGYVKWDEDILENKDEYRYSMGFMTNINRDWTASASYTYRDLKDFIQDDAHEAALTFNYAYSRDTDLGVFAGYSSFDALENGYKLEENFDRAVGVYATWRF